MHVERYTEESLREKGWDKKERERWQVVLVAREECYGKVVQNLLSTCTHTATGRERRPIQTGATLLQFNPVVPEPGSKKVRGRRESSLGRKATLARKRAKKALRDGDKSSNTGYKKSTNRM